MDFSKNFNNYDFIKLDELNIVSDIRIVILYARFMHNTGNNWTLDTHSHSFYELHFPLCGSCRLVLQNSKNTELGVSKYLLIHPNTNHKFTDFSEDFLRLSIAFDIQRDDKILTEDDKYIINDSNGEMLRLLEQMLSEYNRRAFGYKSIVKFHIQTAMIEFLRSNPDILYANKIQNDTGHNIFNKAMTFIRNNVSFNITTEDVAQNDNLSSRQLNRIFISNLNMTISEFIRNERILRVREHLKKTELSLQEIASLTGFNDEYVLCKTFKKITGTTPGKYRLSHKKKGQTK
ncbi:MAG: AraC family transcriptional regulator [Monoglobaceae bacterium]